ncbi:unnamed protein product, partial [Didymodactylos carnosus]
YNMGGKSTKAVDPTVLTPKQIDLLKVNTKFNEQEIRDWHTVSKHFDDVFALNSRVHVI